MALTTCRECGHEVSTAARACPKCGAVPKLGRNWRDVAIVAVGIAIVVAAMWSSDKNAAKTPLPPREQARGACSLFIERAAHDPSSVSFVDYDSWRIDQHSNDTWTVFAAYRAKNPLGALQLSRATCTVRKSGEQWALVSLR